MPAIFVAPNSLLTAGQLAGRRRRLAELLGDLAVEMKSVPAGDGATLAERLAREARGCVVIAVDDAHPRPSGAQWLVELVASASELAPHRRPVVIYVTHRTNGAGLSEVMHHPLVRQYVTRDAKGTWVDKVAAMAAELGAEIKARQAGMPAEVGAAEIVGESACFRQAVEELGQILRMPYGMVSGETGVGKLHLIQALWRQTADEASMVVLPCGSFFKDYYLAGARRRIGGGREAVDQLAPYIDEADDGLLVLHHVEQLPTALQEELAVRLNAAGSKAIANPLCGIDSTGLHERNVKVIATSTSGPEALEASGRLIGDLAKMLARRHVRIPTLRERGARDVELICEDLVGRVAGKLAAVGAAGGVVRPRISPEVMGILRAAPWPGNVGDLVRVVEYAVRHCRGGVIQRRHLPAEMQTAGAKPKWSLDTVLEDAQRGAIGRALLEANGDVGIAAASLGRNKHGLYRLMRTLGMSAHGVDR